MLHAVSKLIGFRIFARDEEMGPVSDCYFESTHWELRYFVVDISEAGGNRKVLISLSAVENIDWTIKRITIREEKQKILESPDFPENLPVPRQYQVALHRYYEWPEYWGQVSFLDTTGPKEEAPQIPADEADPVIPEEGPTDETDPESQVADIANEPDDDEIDEMEFADVSHEEQYDSQLRSSIELNGYVFEAQDGEAGVVRDFLFDVHTYLITFVVIDIRRQRDDGMRLSPISMLSGIDWKSSFMTGRMNCKTLWLSPGYKEGRVVSDKYTKNVFDYYDTLNES